SLYVHGADEDMKRLATMIRTMGDELDAIHITLDSHHRQDISHPIWWRDATGVHPSAFTMISATELEEGRWATTLPGAHERSLEYLRALEVAGRYPHTIWPEHCLIGDEGHNIAPVLSSAIHDWEKDSRKVKFITKGSNPWTEHFSALAAEVPDPEPIGTQLNLALIENLEKADLILVAGEAETHCMLSTVADLAEHFSLESTLQKLVWLSDTTSPVPDPPGTTLFSDKVREVFTDLRARGMKISTSTEIHRIRQEVENEIK
ncbi:hypothetical protein KAI87_01210, partial [Myxococcota bacterium]|nr:hypothetical protein [Myxococcota bacterium]